MSDAIKTSIISFVEERKKLFFHKKSTDNQFYEIEFKTKEGYIRIFSIPTLESLSIDDTEYLLELATGYVDAVSIDNLTLGYQLRKELRKRFMFQCKWLGDPIDKNIINNKEGSLYEHNEEIFVILKEYLVFIYMDLKKKSFS